MWYAIVYLKANIYSCFSSPEADVLAIRRRYTNLYIPSDFFNTQFRWVDAFPPNSPFVLNKPCLFHVMPKDIDNPIANDTVLEPTDVDYLFSAKVNSIVFCVQHWYMINVPWQ